jgi:hypothetical protein
VDLATVQRIAWLCMGQEEGVLPQADVMKTSGSGPLTRKAA